MFKFLYIQILNPNLDMIKYDHNIHGSHSELFANSTQKVAKY